MSEKVIEVKELVKYYGDTIALNGISFEVYKGEIFSLVGPNGAGKTTTVEILECLRQPTSGLAKVLGYDVLREENEIKKRIGVMPQNFNTFERLTVKENVELIANIYRVESNINEYLELLGLYEVRNKRFHTLSGGMKRRVGICMALVAEPELVFLDEPTTGLDPQARKEVWEVIKHLKKIGKTVFLTTHYMEEVEELCDRAAIIVDGRIVHTDRINELISRFGGGIKIVVDLAESVKGVRGVNVKDTKDTDAEKILRKFTDDVFYERDSIVGRFKSRREAGKAIAELYENECKIRIVEPSMDDVFMNLVGRRIDERGELI